MQIHSIPPGVGAGKFTDDLLNEVVIDLKAKGNYSDPSTQDKYKEYALAFTGNPANPHLAPNKEIRARLSNALKDDPNRSKKLAEFDDYMKKEGNKLTEQLAKDASKEFPNGHP